MTTISPCKFQKKMFGNDPRVPRDPTKYTEELQLVCYTIIMIMIIKVSNEEFQGTVF